ncbi:hydantoinase/oxoprolinase family protein [Pandoraea apista]|uniref:hydantoinase/oxoprolinase family protein n=1 Tax=Pandoraea apista TaxID=93218 RepID=UPI0006587A05|nr:hydantoinase/oxoprolinase family protein [Pandoraea apista]ALS68106.1 hydantoinase [Pandoraea apista]RRW96636.1 hydantoinase/oxoprolinase family protein [Pandoraea apista]RRX02195.1 hydantoinase/oxoprolinase family protein [Pandoraea apista]CFB61859.1 Acetophenone carboxylase gamma subunit [Pandoraea apista]
MKVGVEVGGTFTDLVAHDDGRIRVIKVPSTPASPDIGVLDALRMAGIDFATIEDFAHGSTVATNAVLERKGGKVAFVATQGFRDILFLQRHDRKHIYDLFYKKPSPPVQRRACFEAKERILTDGSVDTALDEARFRSEVLPQLEQGAYDAVAICLLNAYRNPAHELRLAELIRAALPNVTVTCSHQVACEFREYERASTATLSAFVQPVIAGYLGRLTQALEREGFRGRFSVMQSNGGRLPADAMRENAISALFSGPAAGVVGAVRQVVRSGYRNVITFDMGGTSSDVCLVQDSKPTLASETEIDGLPVRTPVLDIVTVGAGGGSLIWIDDGGMLRVGPKSAGAQPGPACYGRGGTEPTITDAHVVLGTVRAEAFLGGQMALDVAAAHRAFDQLAAHFGLSVEAVAHNAVRLANANIVRAIQLVSTERGRDPRDYVLVPFGGAGPMQAAQIAEDLGIGTVVAPPNPGVTSAHGLLASDFIKYETQTYRVQVADDTCDQLRERFARMKADLQAQFEQMAFDQPLEFSFTLEMRYVGQAFEVPIELDAAALAALERKSLSEHFTEAHERIYFHADKTGRPIEVVALRVGATLVTPHVSATASVTGNLDAAPGEPALYDGRNWTPCRRRTVAALGADGAALAGPAVLEDYTTTVLVPAGWQASVDTQSNLILSKGV